MLFTAFDLAKKKKNAAINVFVHVHGRAALRVEINLMVHNTWVFKISTVSVHLLLFTVNTGTI